MPKEKEFTQGNDSRISAFEHPAGNTTTLVSVHYKVPREYREKMNKLSAAISVRKGRNITTSELVRIAMRNMLEETGYI